MAYSASGQVEAMMRSDWLTERSEFSALSRKNRFCFGHILNPKLFGIGLAYLFTSTSFNSVDKNAKKSDLDLTLGQQRNIYLIVNNYWMRLSII